MASSRRGALSVAYAGLHPDQVKGVLNFVGGWMTDKCLHGPTINRDVFLRGAEYAHPMLWLYGSGDPYYSTAHIRWAFEVFKAAGGRGKYFTFDVPDTSGHRLYRYQKIWASVVDQYLAEIYLDPGVSLNDMAPSIGEKQVSPFKDAPLPDDLAITKSDPALSDKRQDFTGLWAGKSKGQWNHVLVVEALDPVGGQVIFALGKNKEQGAEQGHWMRLRAVWEASTLIALLNSGHKAIYRVHSPNRMELKFIDDTGQQIDQAWLTRIKPGQK